MYMAWKLTKNGLRIFHDDFPRKVKNIHDEMEKHHSYKKKHVDEANVNLRKSRAFGRRFNTVK